MIKPILISLLYSAPIAWINYMIFKFMIGLYKELHSNEYSEEGIKKLKRRLFLCVIGFCWGISFLTIWNTIVWFPELKQSLPVAIKFVGGIFLLILMLPYMCLIALCISLGKSVGAGSSSGTSIANSAIEYFKNALAVDKLKSSGKKSTETCEASQKKT